VRGEGTHRFRFSPPRVCQSGVSPVPRQPPHSPPSPPASARPRRSEAETGKTWRQWGRTEGQLHLGTACKPQALPRRFQSALRAIARLLHSYCTALARLLHGSCTALLQTPQCRQDAAVVPREWQAGGTHGTPARVSNRPFSRGLSTIPSNERIRLSRGRTPGISNSGS